MGDSQEYNLLCWTMHHGPRKQPCIHVGLFLFRDCTFRDLCLQHVSHCDPFVNDALRVTLFNSWRRFDDDLSVICAIIPAILWLLMMVNFVSAATVDPGIIPKKTVKPAGVNHLHFSSCR